MDKKSKYIGMTSEHKVYGVMKIIEYKNYDHIKVEFDDGTIVNTSYRHFQKGTVKNPNYPLVCGVGYYGQGKYVAKINGHHTKEYLVWRTMINRCYNPAYYLKHPTYDKCEVCDEWLNFQNFAKWFESNYYTVSSGEIIDLDKDFLSKNENKIYSPETCIFIPQSINKMICTQTSKSTSLPTGVKKNYNHYQAVVRSAFGNKDIFLGTYKTKEEAFVVYLKEKTNQMYIKLNAYKDELPKRVFNAIFDYINSDKYKNTCDNVIYNIQLD